MSVLAILIACSPRLTNLAVSYGVYKIAEQIERLQAKQKAGKKQHLLLQKKRLVKSLSL